MTNLKVTIEVIENKEERNNLVERVEVLNRVKELLLLPNMEYATTRQVADFYGVETKTITNMVTDHRDELEEDGYIVINGKDLVSALKAPTKIENMKGYFLIDGNKIGYRHNGLFPKRAILRVWILLKWYSMSKPNKYN